MTEGDKIRTRILIPMAVLLVVLLVVSVTSVYWVQQRHIDEQVMAHLSGTEGLFQNLLDHEAKFVNGQIDFLKADPAIVSAWLSKDREKLINCATPLFEAMRSKYRVTHFYFVEPDKTCFLRVQDPDRYGDKKKLFTLDRVASEGKASYGIELGKLGTFTLRVIHPWVIDRKLAGYMELGMEIEHLTPKLKEAIGADLFFVINKEYLSRAKWEAGLEMLGKKGNWNYFADYALIDGTMDVIPREVREHLDSDHVEKTQDYFKTTSQGRTFRGGCIPLIDAGSRKVGDVVVLTDVTEAKASLFALFVSLTAISIVVGVVLVVLFSFYIGRIGSKLIDNQNRLSEEVEQRKHIEELLRRSNSEMESRIRERTAELAEANDQLQEKIGEHQIAEKKLQEAVDELQRFNNLAVERELRMSDLKDEINGLCSKLGLPEKFRDLHTVRES
jgi:hypothetical protein